MSAKRVKYNHSMGWMGELSSVMLSKCQKLFSVHSDSASEQTLKQLEPVSLVYRPTDLAIIEQIYLPVEKSDLISKQTTTMIYLVKTRANQVSKPLSVSHSSRKSS